MSRDAFINGPSNSGITERFDTAIYKPQAYKTIVNDNVVSTCLIIDPSSNRDLIVNMDAQKADLGHIGYGLGYTVCDVCFGSRSKDNHVNGMPNQWIDVTPGLGLYYKWQFVMKSRKDEIQDHRYAKEYKEAIEQERDFRARYWNAGYENDMSPEDWAKWCVQYYKQQSRIYEEIANDFAKNRVDVFTQYRCNFCEDKEWIIMRGK